MGFRGMGRSVFGDPHNKECIVDLDWRASVLIFGSDSIPYLRRLGFFWGVLGMWMSRSFL